MKVLINPRTKCVHDPACRWLAGSSVDLRSLIADDLTRLSDGHRPCSYCAPAIGPPAR